MSYHLFPTDEDLPDDMTRTEVQETLDALDAAWRVPEDVTKRIRQRFLKLLAEQEPDHPWVQDLTSES